MAAKSHAHAASAGADAQVAGRLPDGGSAAPGAAAQPATPAPEAEVAARAPAPSAAPQAAAPARGRLASLDAFRGLTIGLMLLVNNIALDTATPAQLTHAPFGRGIRLADLVFPWFLFIVGVAIPFSAASARRKGLSVWRHDLRIIKRTVGLVLLGCLLDSSILRRPVFSLGVLQLIGLAYLVGAFLYDLPLSPRMLVAALLLVGYWVAIKFLPVPGVGTGVFEENRNLLHYLNRTELAGLGLSGLPSVIPTAALVLIGTAIGDLLRNKNLRYTQQVAWCLAIGGALVAVGVLWSLSLPFSKAYWTPSYILATGGTGAMVLGLFYLVIDGAGWRWWAYPLVVFGANAIMAYAVPILTKELVLQVWQVNPGGSGLRSLQQYFLDFCVNREGRIAGGWTYTLGYMAVWWLLLWYFYRKRVFLRL